MPRICFINKLDRIGANFERSYKSILDRLSKKAVRFQIPIGEEDHHEGVIDLLKMKAYYFEGNMGSQVIEKEIPENLKAEAEKYRAELIERIVENDEDLMTAYLEGKEISISALKETLRKAVIANKIFPVMTGSALKNKGVQLVLDAVVDYLPSPLDIPPIKAIDANTGEEVLRHASDSEPFSALAFKLQADPFVGQLTFFRVYSGTIESGSYIYNSTTGNKERLGRIVRLQADKREEVKKFSLEKLPPRSDSRMRRLRILSRMKTILLSLIKLLFLNRLSRFALNRRPRPTKRKWVWLSNDFQMKTQLLN